MLCWFYAFRLAVQKMLTSKLVETACKDVTQVVKVAFILTLFLKKMGQPRPPFCLFWSFQLHYNFYNKYM